MRKNARILRETPGRTNAVQIQLKTKQENDLPARVLQRATSARGFFGEGGGMEKEIRHDANKGNNSKPITTIGYRDSSV